MRVYEFAGVEQWNGTVERTTGLEYWRGVVKRYLRMRTLQLTSRVSFLYSLEERRSVEIMDECGTLSNPIVIDDGSPASVPARSPVKILDGDHYRYAGFISVHVRYLHIDTRN